MPTENNRKRKKYNKESLKEYAKYSNLGFQMLFIILLGVFGGIQLDKLIPFSFPIFTVLGAVLSVLGAMFYAIKDLLK